MFLVKQFGAYRELRYINIRTGKEKNGTHSVLVISGFAIVVVSDRMTVSYTHLDVYKRQLTKQQENTHNCHLYIQLYYSVCALI